MLESSLASQFPEFTLSDFKTSCLNENQPQNANDKRSIFPKEEFTPLASSVSMPAFTPLTPQVSDAKKYVYLKHLRYECRDCMNRHGPFNCKLFSRTPASINPPPPSASMNFALDQRIQQQQQPFTMNASAFPQSTVPTLPLSQIQLPIRNSSNTVQPNYQLTNNTNSFGSLNSMNALNSLNAMNKSNVLTANPVHMNAKTPDNKQIQLSAQEINDFLS